MSTPFPEYPDGTPIPETPRAATVFVEALFRGARRAYRGTPAERDRDAAVQVDGLARHARRSGRPEIAEAYERAAVRLLTGGP